MSRTAVVILNYNGEKLLQQFLPSVIQHSAEAEIIIADNRSTDHSMLFVRQTFPQVRIIQLDQNYGYCGGYNRALKQVDADYYVLLNSDIEVTPHLRSCDTVPLTATGYKVASGIAAQLEHLTSEVMVLMLPRSCVMGNCRCWTGERNSRG